MLDNHLVDIVAIKSFVRNNVVNPHNRAHVIGLLDNIMILLNKTYDNQEVPDKIIECTCRILNKLKERYDYDWQC